MILNLTQHAATETQKEAGVVDLSPEQKAKLCSLLTLEKDALTASPEVRDTLLDSRVASIVALIWPQVSTWFIDRAKRTLEVADELGAMAGWNEGHRPLGQAMIGGAPYLVERLARRLKELEVTPLYATSERVSVEETQPDGSVRKVQVFQHLGFVEAL